MAVSGAIIDYTGAGGERNFTIFIQLTFSGSFTTGGDPLNLATLSNPNGLDVEGVFELPLIVGACGVSGGYRRILRAAEDQRLDLDRISHQCLPTHGHDRFRRLQQRCDRRQRNSHSAEASRLKPSHEF